LSGGISGDTSGPAISGGEYADPTALNNLEAAIAKAYLVNAEPSTDLSIPDAATELNPTPLASLDPKTVKQAMNSPNANEWRQAMQSEFNALRKKHVFEVIPKPEGRNIVGCRWVLKTKRDKNGAIDKYRARLVAQGFSQVAGEDFEDTFAPVVKFCTTRILLAIAAQHTLIVYHWDVETAYLNADLQDEIFMKVPEGCEISSPSGEPHVLQLRKCLYGLKQSGREWYLELTASLKNFGFESACGADPCLFVHRRQSDQLLDMVLCLYVDDLLIATKDDHLKDELLKFLNRKYSIKDMGILTWYLGMEVSRDEDGSYTIRSPSADTCKNCKRDSV
jgi:hypothetical protein